jgi:hypothetical protein
MGSSHYLTMQRDVAGGRITGIRGWICAMGSLVRLGSHRRWVRTRDLRGPH